MSALALHLAWGSPLPPLLRGVAITGGILRVLLGGNCPHPRHSHANGNPLPTALASRLDSRLRGNDEGESACHSPEKVNPTSTALAPRLDSRLRGNDSLHHSVIESIFRSLLGHQSLSHCPCVWRSPLSPLIRGVAITGGILRVLLGGNCPHPRHSHANGNPLPTALASRLDSRLRGNDEGESACHSPEKVNPASTALAPRLDSRLRGNDVPLESAS